MKGIFIINPSSGRQNFREKLYTISGKLVLEQICSSIDVFYTEKKDDAMNRAAALAAGEYDFVVSVGGDGTLNEVIQGIIAGGSGIPVAVLSTGTVNDFANYLKLPQTPKEFCAMIKRFETKRVDAGKINDKYFINVVAAGLMTDIGYKVGKDQKDIRGKLAYYLEGAMDFPQKFGQPMNQEFTSDKGILVEEVLLFMVANSSSVGGFKGIMPLASTTDGQFDVIIIKKMDIFKAIPLMISILQGDHIRHPSVEYFQTSHLRIESLFDEDFKVDYDGELLDGGFPLEIETVPGAVQIIVPGTDLKKISG